ncbi:MAG TPA: hypothetical protein VIR30_01540 [Nocardioides sp.]
MTPEEAVSGRLNCLSAEAIDAAVLLAAITVTGDTPLLRRAATELAVPFELHA